MNDTMNAIKYVDLKILLRDEWEKDLRSCGILNDSIIHNTEWYLLHEYSVYAKNNQSKPYNFARDLIKKESLLCEGESESSIRRRLIEVYNI